MSISSIVDLAAGKIVELLLKEATFLYGVEGQVRSLQKEVEMVQSFLIDMEVVNEEGGNKQSLMTRTAIKEIKKIAYDAEDVVESYILEANSSTDKKEDSLKRYLCFCCSLSRTHQVGCEIEAIQERLNKTMEMWKKYAGESRMLGAHARQNKNSQNARQPAYPHIHEEHVVGLDEDINKLVRVLTHEKYHKINVVLVVGMSGSGKTTLARKLYNHESVKKHFDCIAWVSVSQQWDAQQIMLDLLNKVKGETMGADESSFSHQVRVGKLYEYLAMKSYLIVLDDVWEGRALNDIRPALPLGGDERKIIVTTRKAEVVNDPDLRPLTYSHEPRRLTDEESWELFRKIALVHRQDANNPGISAELEELGKKMLKKCRGLPLAVTTLAGILCAKKNLEEWEMVSKTVSSRIMEHGTGPLLYGPVKGMLALSYIDLPYELKPCFIHLARYPEDSKIHVGELIRTWIAEGFITQSREGCTFEDVAGGYLDELVYRCLVLVGGRNYQGKVKYIRIHDLVRDLCIEKAKEEDFLETFTPTTSYSNRTMTELRRAVAFFSFQERNLLPFPVTNSRHLRSLFISGIDYSLLAKCPNLEAVHQNFSLLRILILEVINTSSETLPEGIGSLIHLRYLGLRGTNIIRLPSSIGNLRNLLTLDWSKNYTMEGMIKIPNVLWKLERLTYLSFPCGFLNQKDLVDVKALKLDTLKLLQTLKVRVGGGSWMVEELPKLSTNIQKLTIHDIGSQEMLEAVFRSPSISSDCLRSLCLSWRDGITLQNYNLEEPIKLGLHLRKLCLVGRMAGDGSGIQFPARIDKLVLARTKFEAETTLVALGKLPHLIVMEFFDNVCAGKRWTCRAGEFPQLKELTVAKLENLEEWSIERGAMPHLTTLDISGCEKLRKLPEGLKLINTLKYLDVEEMGDELMERIKGGGGDAHIIQHVPHVAIC